MTMTGETPINLDPPRNPATGMIAAILTGIGAEVSRIRQLLHDDRIQKTIHRTPMRNHLELHAEKWVLMPAAANTLALRVGPRIVATVVVPANGVIEVSIPITIAGGQDVNVINAVTGAVVDGNSAVIVDSYLIGSIGGSKA